MHRSETGGEFRLSCSPSRRREGGFWVSPHCQESASGIILENSAYLSPKCSDEMSKSKLVTCNYQVARLVRRRNTLVLWLLNLQQAFQINLFHTMIGPDRWKGLQMVTQWSHHCQNFGKKWHLFCYFFSTQGNFREGERERDRTKEIGGESKVKEAQREVEREEGKKKKKQVTLHIGTAGAKKIIFLPPSKFF